MRVNRVLLSSSTEEFRSRVAEALGVALRASTRVLVNLHVGVDDSRSTRVYETENLSKSGMLLRTGHPLAVGTEFAFDICLPQTGGALQGLGSVVRHTEPDREKLLGMGIRFESLDNEASNCIDRFVRQQRIRPAQS